MLDLAPGVSNASALYELLTGKTATGDEANRYFAAIGLVPVLGAIIKKGGQAVHVFAQADKAVDAAKVGGQVGVGGAKGTLNTSLLDELTASGVKFTPENVVATSRSSSGKVVFLETRNSKAGLQHIIEEHGSQFAQMGVSEAQIPGVVMSAVSEGKLVGYQGSGIGRPIYELKINGQTQRIAVTVGDNGFVVGASPRGALSETYKINGGLSVLSDLEYVPR